jgi:tRNA(Ile)-lysidine synthase
MGEILELPGQQQLPVDRPCLVGVSGGCDSVTLLHLLHEAGHRELVVCHLDHGLRGEESDGDRRFVESLAAGYGYQSEVECIDVAHLAETSGESIEQAGRKARHRFFAGIAAVRGVCDVVLAHHADDQAETIMHNLLRGSGMRGLVGMRGSRKIEVDGVTLTLRRPLLGVRRAAIRDFAAKRGIVFREDASNARRECVRNRVRLDLLPHACDALGRDVVDAITRLGEQMRRDIEFMDQLAAAALLEAESLGSDEGLSVAVLRNQHPCLRVRVVSAWLARQGVRDLSAALLERIEVLLAEGSDVARENLPGGKWVRRRAGRLFIQQPREE